MRMAAIKLPVWCPGRINSTAARLLQFDAAVLSLPKRRFDFLRPLGARRWFATFQRPNLNSFNHGKNILPLRPNYFELWILNCNGWKYLERPRGKFPRGKREFSFCGWSVLVLCSGGVDAAEAHRCGFVLFPVDDVGVDRRDEEGHVVLVADGAVADGLQRRRTALEHACNHTFTLVFAPANEVKKRAHFFGGTRTCACDF